MLVTSILSFSHDVFYPIYDKFNVFSDIKFVVCKRFQFRIQLKFYRLVDGQVNHLWILSIWTSLKLYRLEKSKEIIYFADSYELLETCTKRRKTADCLDKRIVITITIIVLRVFLKRMIRSVFS